MREYGKVHTTFWASETIRTLDDDARLLALYLLTSPHTHQSGVFRLPAAYACHDMGWIAERLANGFKTLSDAGWARRCDKTDWVWIINFTVFNKPDNPNQRKAIEKHEALVPSSCQFYREWSGEPLSNSSKSSGNLPAPAPVALKKKGGRSKSEDVTLPDWLASLPDDALAVPADDAVFEWAGKTGIPREWIALAWWAFEARYESDAKTYRDWRAVFRRAVREDWLRLWRQGRDGWELTTAGEAMRREMGT
jgi:hypothetical protein